MEKKYCSKCQQYKRIDEFYRTQSGGCIKCVRKYQNKYYAEHYAVPKFVLSEGLKKCCGCKEIKLVGEFYHDKYNNDGYHHYCKNCSDEKKRIKLGRVKANKIMSPPGKRKCRKCGIPKFHEEYESQRGVICRKCIEIRKQDLANRKLTANERRKAYIREYRKRPEVQAKEKEYAYSYNRRLEVILRNREHNRKFRERPENREKARLKTIKWRNENIERARHQEKIGRDRRRNAEGSYTLEQWETLLSFFDCCPNCGKQNNLTIDHIIPISKGGTGYIDNIQPLCFRCNTKKNAHLIIDYRPQEARLWAHKQMINLEFKQNGKTPEKQL